MWMPALASANSGTITRLVHGCRRCWRRSLGEIAEATRELGRAGERGRGLLAERPRLLGHALEVDARRRVGAGDQPHREPGDHRVDAGLQQRHPHRHADHRRHPQAPLGRGEAQREERQRTARPPPRAGRRRCARCTRWRSRSAPRSRRPPPTSGAARAGASRARRGAPSAPSANAVSVDIAAPQPLGALAARVEREEDQRSAPSCRRARRPRRARSGAARAAGRGRARAWPRARRRGSRTSSGPR